MNYKIKFTYQRLLDKTKADIVTANIIAITYAARYLHTATHQ